MSKLLAATKRTLVQAAVIVPLFVVRAYLPSSLRHVFDAAVGALCIAQAVVAGIRGVKERRNEKRLAAAAGLFALGTATWIWATEIAVTYHEFVVVAAVGMCVGAAMIFDLNERRNADGSPRAALAASD